MGEKYYIMIILLCIITINNKTNLGDSRLGDLITQAIIASIASLIRTNTEAVLCCKKKKNVNNN